MVSDNFLSASENAEAADYNLNLLMALADLDLQDIESLLNEYAEFENLKEALEAVKDVIDSASNEVDSAGNWLKNLLDNLFNGNNSNTDDGTMGPFLPTSGNGPEDQGSPLVIDLDGDGIELYAAGTYGTYFDLRGNGQAVLTGWVSPDDGLLAVDTNNNGRIDDIGELFGSMSAQGFGELAALDLNADGVIDANDAGFSGLLVWRDLNSDGVSQAAELQSLSGLDITSISLDVTRVHQEVGGNTITHEADIIIGGTARTIADAWFAYDAHMTRNSAAYDLDIRAAFLPTLRGFGDLKDLHIAASLDNGAGAETLMSRLIDFANGLSLAGAIADWPASVAAAGRHALPLGGR